MATRTCGQCKAPLQKETAGEATRCEFCGAINEPFTRSVYIQVTSFMEPPIEPNRSRSLVVLIAVIGGIAPLAAMILIYILSGEGSDRESTDQKKSVPAPAQSAPAPAPHPAPPPEKKAIPVSELSRVPLESSQLIEAPKPVTEISRFDALANLEWAARIARAWSTDAEIWDIQVHGLRAEGIADLSSRDDFSVEYQFKSSARRRAAIEIGTVTEKNVPSDLFIEVKNGSVRVHTWTPTVSYLIESANRPPMQLTCPPARVVEAALKDHVTPLPFYDVETSYSDETGWSWLFDPNNERRISTANCKIVTPKKSHRKR